MTQMIAGNTQHTGRSNRGYAESWTREQLDGLLSEAWLKQMVNDIRGGKEKLKDSLPFICPHYAAFRNNHRAQKDIIPEMFTFMTCVDVDDKGLVEKAIRNCSRPMWWQVGLLRLTSFLRSMLLECVPRLSRNRPKASSCAHIAQEIRRKRQLMMSVCLRFFIKQWFDFGFYCKSKGSEKLYKKKTL